MHILFEDNHLLVVEKPRNLPVQKDASGDIDFQTMLKGYLKEKYNKPGNVYLGIVHRLDRPVGGVMVFAKTSKAAARLTLQFKNGETIKKYYAVVHGLPAVSATLEDHLLKGDKNFSRVVNEKTTGAKYAQLHYNLLEQNDELSLLDIKLDTGRAHQIRIQLSSRQMPIWGDMRYGRMERGHIALFAYSLSIVHPISKEPMHFALPLPSGMPWALFS